MRRLFAGMAMLALAVGGAAAADTDWAVFRDPGGVFTVEFPGAAKTEIVTPKADTDKFTAGASYHVDSPTTSLILMDRTMRPDIHIDLSRMKDGMVVGGGTISDETDIVVDGQKGIAFKALDAHGYEISDHAFFVNGHVYQQISVMRPDAAPEIRAQSEHFLNSLHFTVPAP